MARSVKSSLKITNRNSKIDWHSARGIRVRNEHAAEYMSDVPDDTRLAVSFGGAGHVAGRVAKDSRNAWPFKHSLTMNLKNRGFSILAITSPPYSKELVKHVPDEFVAGLNGNERLVIDGLPPTITVDIPKDEVFSSQETAWVNKRLESLKMGDLVVPNLGDFMKPFRGRYEAQRANFVAEARSIAQTPSPD